MPLFAVKHERNKMDCKSITNILSNPCQRNSQFFVSPSTHLTDMSHIPQGSSDNGSDQRSSWLVDNLDGWWALFSWQLSRDTPDSCWPWDSHHQGRSLMQCFSDQLSCSVNILTKKTRIAQRATWTSLDTCQEEKNWSVGPHCPCNWGTSSSLSHKQINRHSLTWVWSAQEAWQCGLFVKLICKNPKA